jgi:hypothetical protein
VFVQQHLFMGNLDFLVGVWQHLAVDKGEVDETKK